MVARRASAIPVPSADFMLRNPLKKGQVDHFPFPFGIQHTGSVYGSMANDYPAIGVVGVLDMLFVFFLGQGKSPFL